MSYVFCDNNSIDRCEGARRDNRIRGPVEGRNKRRLKKLGNETGGKIASLHSFRLIVCKSNSK